MTPEELEQKRQAAIDRINNARRPKGRTARPAFDTTKMASDGIQRANPGGILAQPIPVSQKGTEYMEALDRVAPNVYAPTPQKLAQQPGTGLQMAYNAQEIMRPRASQGPMSGIYGSRALNPSEKRGLEIYGGGAGLAKAYNEAQPRSAERASTLNSIWQRGGVPVIGGGKERAAVQDFGGVDQSVRGIDTGIRAGSPEAEAQQAKMDAAGRGDVYGRPAGIGLQQGHLDQMHGNNLQSRDSRRRRDAGAYFANQERQNQPRGGTGLTSDQALKKYEIDQNAGIKREEIAAADRRAQEARDADANAKAAAKAAEGISEANGVFVGPDGKPLSEPEQKMWSARKTALTSVAEPQTAKALAEMRKNPDQWTAMIDRQTGKLAVLPSTTKGVKGDWGKPNWMGETLSDDKPRYQNPYEYDPVIAGILYSNYGI
jgi:hypothetical protein